MAQNHRMRSKAVFSPLVREEEVGRARPFKPQGPMGRGVGYFSTCAPSAKAQGSPNPLGV